MNTILNWIKGKPKPKVERMPIDISAEELEAMGLSSHPYYLLDLRDTAGFRKGHIKGAHLVPYIELNKRTHELPMDRLIVTVDSSVRRGRQAAKLLNTEGFEARNLKGGIQAWTGKLVK